MSMGCRAIFNEFQGMRKPSIFNVRVDENSNFQKFILDPKNWTLILKDFEFLDIFIESKWGVFRYLHLCFKVNGE